MLNEIQKISAKDLRNYMVISESSSVKLLTDIKKEYDIKIVTIHHLMRYLKIVIPLSN